MAKYKNILHTIYYILYLLYNKFIGIAIGISHTCVGVFPFRNSFRVHIVKNPKYVVYNMQRQRFIESLRFDISLKIYNYSQSNCNRKLNIVPAAKPNTN